MTRVSGFILQTSSNKQLTRIYYHDILTIVNGMYIMAIYFTTLRSQLLLQSTTSASQPTKSNFNNKNPTPTNHCPRIVHRLNISDDPQRFRPGACNLSACGAMLFGVAAAEPCEFSLCISASAAQCSIHDGGGVPGSRAGWESASTSLKHLKRGNRVKKRDNKYRKEMDENMIDAE